MRTEIMFRRIDTENLVDPSSYASNENYLKAVKLYRLSYKLEMQGDVEGFTDTYLQAIRLQRAAQVSSFSLSLFFLFFLSLSFSLSLFVSSLSLSLSPPPTQQFCRHRYLNSFNYYIYMKGSVAKDADDLFKQVLPYELYMQIFSYLSDKELVPLLRVAKNW